jgi:hypothetical protein
MILPEWQCVYFVMNIYGSTWDLIRLRPGWLPSWRKFNGEWPLSELSQGEGNRPADCTWNCLWRDGQDPFRPLRRLKPGLSRL